MDRIRYARDSIPEFQRKFAVNIWDSWGISDGVTLFVIAALLVEILGILAAVHAVMNARTPQGAIAWGITLITFPWLALIPYGILGRNKFKGYVLLRNSCDSSVQHMREEIQADAVEQQLVRPE